MKMSNKALKTPLIIAASTVLTIGLSATSVVNAAENPFSMTALSSGYMVVASAEGKCGSNKGGEAKCGSNKGEEAKCGNNKGSEAKFGSNKGEEAKCGSNKGGEAKCGEGKCGG